MWCRRWTAQIAIASASTSDGGRGPDRLPLPVPDHWRRPIKGAAVAVAVAVVVALVVCVTQAMEDAKELWKKLVLGGG